MPDPYPPSTIHHLRSSILDFITTSNLATFDDTRFNDLAIELFRYQFLHNAVYRTFCEQVSPIAINPRFWQEIPAVTTSAFKYATLACFSPEKAVAVFHTSGTSVQRSGKHYFQTLDFYRTALLRSFRAYCLPDREKMCMLLLGPTAEHFPNSSLGYMFSAVRSEFGTADSAAFFTSKSLYIDDFLNAMERAIQQQEPVFVLGTAFNILKCVDAMQSRHQHLPLPAGSRILDTGGYKGRTREVARKEFQDMLCDVFGAAENSLLNEYGMTELSSQFYESQLLGAPQQDERPGIKFMPPWMRVVAVDPETLRPLPEGELGMLRIFDLANVDSVLAIQTEDLGRAWKDRIELAGRASGAELRGCSLLTEMLVSD